MEGSPSKPVSRSFPSPIYPPCPSPLYRYTVSRLGVAAAGAPGSVEQLHPGDVVEIEVPGIGTLQNPVVAEE